MDTELTPYNSKRFRFATTPKIVKMFRIRGYEVTGFTSEENGYKTAIQGRYYGGSFYFNFEHFTELQIEQEIDSALGYGQHHVQHICGHILLRGIEGNTTRYYVYRDVQSGPQSSWVWECPGCKQELREDEIQFIED